MSPWPPEEGKGFIQSEEFGRILVALTEQLSSRYPQMDFGDAVAQVFVWFDQKLSSNRRFINSRRFPTRSAFRAYLRQAVWNAARVAARKRRRREEIEALSVDLPIIAGGLGTEERAQLLEMLDGLPEPHKTVFDKFFFDEEDVAMIASILNLCEEDIERLYEEALDMLRTA